MVEDWLLTFPNSLVKFLAREISDHSSALLTLSSPPPIAGSKPFKFFNYLTSHPDFQSTVIREWEQTTQDSWSLSNISKKQKTLRRFLKLLNKNNYSDIQKRVAEVYCHLKELQQKSLDSPSTANFLEEKVCKQKWDHLRTVEEAYFHQKSRIHWLKVGDQNTGFYHSYVMARNYYNAIHALTDLNGVTVPDPEQIGLLAVFHFHCILGPSLSPVNLTLLDSVQAFTMFSCSDVQSALLSALPTDEEVMRTLFKLNPNKSPGPDGLTSRFYSCSWRVLGQEVTSGIIRFFSSCEMPTATNSTILTLIPKFPGATIIKDYRPISCCNTLYKVISKLLVSRLKPLLPQIILPNQSAFVKGRLLLENCLLASEIISGDHKNKGAKRLTLKVDIAKAFDSLKWDFVLACLTALNLPTQFISWVKECISTVAYSVGINGSLHGFFRGTRRLASGRSIKSLPVWIGNEHFITETRQSCRNWLNWIPPALQKL